MSTATARVGLVDAKIAQLTDDIAKLHSHKKPTAAEKKSLKAKQAQLKDVQGRAVPLVKKELADANAGLVAAKSRLRNSQSAALSAEKKANDAFRARNVNPFASPPFPQADSVDSMDDAASLSGANFKQIAGGPNLVSANDALKGDVGRINLALKQSPKNGLAMLTSQLKGADPQYRETLLKQVGPQLATMADEAASDPDTAAAYAKAMEYAPEQIQDKMAQVLAGESDKGGTAIAAGLKQRMDSSGDPAAFKVTSKVMAALTKSGNTQAADAVAGAAASTVHDLREDFEEKSAKTDTLSAELWRLNKGFGNLTTEPQKEAAITGFRKSHAADFDATDRAAAKLAAAEEVFTSAPPVDPGALETLRDVRDHRVGVVDVGRAILNGDTGQGAAALRLEAEGVVNDLPALVNTESGASLTASNLMSSVKNGSKSWVDTVITDSKDSKSLVEKGAKGLTKAMGYLAMSGQLGTPEDAMGLIRANANTLGVPAGKLGKVQDAIFELYDARDAGQGAAAAAAKVEDAFGKLDGGKWPNLKLFGAAIGVAGAAGNFQKWGELATSKQVKTVVDLSKAGVDGANYVASLLGNKGVAAGLSKVGGGIGVVGGVLNGIIGVEELAKGKYGDGVGDVATGAGDILLGMAAISEDFPGAGTLVGAGLAVAGLIAKHVFGSDPRGDALKASEKDAKAYLQAAGLPKELVGPLSQLDIDNHRNIGTFVSQAAQAWGMTPQELMKKLAAHPDELDDMVQMVLSMPVDDDWKYQAAKKPGDLGDGPYTAQAGFYQFGPHSLESAKQWLEQRGVLPEDP